MANDHVSIGRGRVSLRELLWRQIVDRRLASPLGLVLLLMLALPPAWLLGTQDFKTDIIIVAVIIGLPMVVIALLNPAFNIALMLFSSLIVTLALRYVNAPMGLLLDALIVVGGLSVLLNQFQERDASFLRNGLSYMILIWLFYNAISVLNPGAASRLAWLYTVRTIALQLLVFFIGAFALRKNKKASFALFYLILFLCFVCAVYGLKQQYFGLSAGEMAWIAADPNRHNLYIQWGMVRVMSLCYDPTTFGLLMSSFAVICGIMAIGVKNWYIKALLLAMAWIALMAMGFSGTRTAVVIIPAGIVFYMILTMNRQVLIAGGIFLMLGGVLMFKSTNSGVIYRLQSAFKPGENDSMQVRLKNQERIQPFIRSHPLGAGLGSCGAWGARFSPGSWLSTFQHDSSFVRLAIELGWIGLILYTLLHFMVLRTGIYFYIRCRDPWIKTLYAAITTACYMLAIASYAQEAIPQQPLAMVYYTFLAMLVTLKNYDPAYAPAENQPTPIA